MPLTLGSIAAEAWQRWRRDRGGLLPLAGVFLFLPMLAWLWFVPEPAIPPGADAEQASPIIMDWLGRELHWLVLRLGVELLGSAAILTLYLSDQHRTLGDALRRALWLLPGFALAVAAGWLLAGIAAFPLILPGLYVYGRLALTGACYAARPGDGVFASVMGSIAICRNNGWRVFGYLALTLLAGQVAVQVVGTVLNALGGEQASPVAGAVLEALAALAVSVTGLARIMLEIGLYRRLAAR